MGETAAACSTMSMEVDEDEDAARLTLKHSPRTAADDKTSEDQAHTDEERRPIANGRLLDSRRDGDDVAATAEDEIQCTSIFTLQGHKRSVSSLAISPDGTELVSSGADGLLKVWSLASGALRVTLDAVQATGGTASQRSGISDVAWSRDGRYIVCGGDDRVVRVWDARNDTLQCEMHGHTSFVFCVTFSPDVTLAVSGGFDETVRMWDLQRKRCHRTIAAHSEAVTGVAYNRDGSILASCSYDGLIRLWDAYTGQCLKTLVHGEAQPVGHVAFSPNSFQLLATSLDGTIRLWDMANGRVLKTYVGHQNAKYALKAAFTAWDIKANNSMKTQQNLSGDHDAAASTPVRQNAAAATLPCLIVAGSEDQRVYLWDLQSKRVVRALQGHRDVALCISTHPHIPIIASASLDRDPCIKIWRLHRKAT